MKDYDSIAKQSGLSRRRFLGGALATALASGAAAETSSAPQTSLRPQARPENLSEIEDIEALKDQVFATRLPMYEQVINVSDSIYKDVDVVIDRVVHHAEKYAEYDTLFALIHAELPLSGIPEPLQSAVRDMMLFIPYIESRFDPEAVSPQAAFGIMQLMPATWNEHAKESDDISNIIDQVQVAGRLVEQIYRYVSVRHATTIETITELVFAGDSQRCQKEFLLPLMMAGYFCGLGTVSNVLDGFAHDYIDLTDVERMRREHILDEEYGLYSVCCKAGEVHQYDALFGSEAAVYFSKILSARESVRLSIPADLFEEMIYGKNA